MNNQSGGNVFDLFCLPSGHDQSGGAGRAAGAEVAPKHES